MRSPSGSPTKCRPAPTRLVLATPASCTGSIDTTAWRSYKKKSPVPASGGASQWRCCRCCRSSGCCDTSSPRPLQQGPAQNQERHAEVDAQTGDVYQRGDERRRCGGGIEAELPQKERQHASGECAEANDSDQGPAHREGHQQVVRAVVDEAQALPQHDPEEADGAQKRAQDQAGGNFAAAHFPPVPQP